jgi:hypothetical protein
MWWNSVVKLWEYQCRSVFRCTHCKSKELHRLYNVPGQKTYCPLKKNDRLKTHRGARGIVLEKQAHPEQDLPGLVAAALEKHT